MRSLRRHGTLVVKLPKEVLTVSSKVLNTDVSRRRSHGAAWHARHAGTIRKALLACGVLYGLAYVVFNDAIAATIYDGYSRLNQAISELSSPDAPSRAFLAAMLPVFSLLVIGFGVGVWKAAKESRALRVTGALLIAQGLVFPLWLLFPMTSRAEMITEGSRAANDVGHLVLTAVSIALILAEMGFSAAALGKGFRVFTIAMAVTTLIFGALTGVLTSGIESGDPTNWMGFVERVSYGAWLMWMAVLAIVLLRRDGATRRMLGS